MKISIFDLMFKGQFSELARELSLSPEIDPYLRAEHESQLNFQVGKFKENTKDRLLIGVFEPIILNSFCSKILKFFAGSAFNLINLVNPKIVKNMRSSFIVDVIHFRYTDFKAGLFLSYWLVALPKDNLAEQTYFRGLLGHFLILNGKTKIGLDILLKSELGLKNMNKTKVDPNRLHQYLSEVSAMLTYHLSALGYFEISQIRFQNQISDLKDRPYFWVELFLRSMRMGESLETLDASALYKDITAMKKMLGPKDVSKYLLRTKVFSSVISASQGDLNLARELLSDLTQDYATATSRIELGRFYLLLSLLSLEIGEFDNAVNNVMKAKIFFSEIPNAITHRLDADLIGYEVFLRAIPHSDRTRRHSMSASQIRTGILSIRKICGNDPSFKVRCETLLGVSYLLDGEVGKAQKIFGTIEEKYKVRFRRFFLSMSVIAPLGLDRSLKEIGVRTDVLLSRNLMSQFTEFLLGADSLEALSKLLTQLLGTPTPVRIDVDSTQIGKTDRPTYSCVDLADDILSVQFQLKTKLICCEAYLPLMRPEWDATLDLQLTMIATILQYIENKDQYLESEKVRAFSDVATQVAHDIRSPLSALNLVVGSISDLSEDRRTIIRNSVQRINDIANDLLSKGRFLPGPNLQNNLATAGITSKVLICSIIDSIVSEKRIQYRDKIDLQIETLYENAVGLFARVNASELSRVLSNLINNSVEAMPNAKGKVTLGVMIRDKTFTISINDNGSGISEELLARLGQPGVSFGKDLASGSGSGMGIFQAKQLIERWNGRLKIVSELGKGTSVYMSLPWVEPPSWFKSDIKLASRATIVILDDDVSIHNIWQSRLDDFALSDTTLKILNFTSAIEFGKLKLDDTMVFFIDFELLNQNTNGLEIIINRNISNRSTLVTGRYEDVRIKEICAAHNIKILPKNLAGSLPIHILDSEDSRLENDFVAAEALI